MTKHWNIIWHYCQLAWNKGKTVISLQPNFGIIIKLWDNYFVSSLKSPFATVLPHKTIHTIKNQIHPFRSMEAHFFNLCDKITEFIDGDSLQLDQHPTAQAEVIRCGLSPCNVNSLFSHLSLLMTERAVDCQRAWRHSQKTLFSKQHRMRPCLHCWLHSRSFVE